MEIAQEVEVRMQRKKGAVSQTAAIQYKKSNPTTAKGSRKTGNTVIGMKSVCHIKRKSKTTKVLMKAQRYRVVTINTEEVYAYVVNRVPDEQIN